MMTVSQNEMLLSRKMCFSFVSKVTAAKSCQYKQTITEVELPETQWACNVQKIIGRSQQHAYRIISSGYCGTCAYKYDLVAFSIIFSNIESLLSEILLRFSARCLRKGPLHPIIWIIHATRLPLFQRCQKSPQRFLLSWHMSMVHRAVSFSNSIT